MLRIGVISCLSSFVGSFDCEDGGVVLRVVLFGICCSFGLIKTKIKNL